MKNEINGYNWFECPAISNNMVELVESNITCAISDYEEEEGEKLSDEQITEFYDTVQSILDDFEENGKVKDLQQFVGNFPVNHDFLAQLKEQIENE